MENLIQNTADLQELLAAVNALPNVEPVDPASMSIASAMDVKNGYGLGYSVTVAAPVPVDATILKVFACVGTYRLSSSPNGGVHPYGTPTIEEAEDYTVGEDGSVSLTRFISTGSTQNMMALGIRLSVIVLYIAPELDAPEISLEEETG